MIFLAFILFFNWYTAYHIAVHWLWAREHAWLFWISALAFFLLELFWIASSYWLSRMRESRHPLMGRVFTAAYYGSFVALGAFSCQFVYTFIGDVIGTALKFFPAASATFEAYNLPVICSLTAITVIAGMVQVKGGPYVEMVDVPLKNLPPAFDGFRIVQISDLHLSPTIRRAYAEKVVHMANGLKPDMMVLTGDFIDGSVEELREDAAPLATLSAPHGVWFVTGNHEYYWNAASWVQEFRRLGIRVLVNEHEVIKKGGDAIVLGGITDFSTRHWKGPEASDPARAFAGAPSGVPKILLAHQSASYKAAHAAGADLQLSGHTHAGQYFPFTLLIRFFQRYYRGLNNHEGMWVYVNTGTGYWGPPMRGGAPSEISLLRLVKA